jgi:nicotinamide mononucleotide transporter
MGLGYNLHREFSGWKTWQVLWMGFSVVTILAISLYQGESLIGLLAAVSGVICVILCGMGRLSSYIFGTVNTLLYAYIAYKARYYGDVMLNLLYYFPTNLLGWYLWSRNLNDATNAVIMKRMTLKQVFWLFLFCVASVTAYGFFLQLIGGNLPFADSMTTVLSVIAQILMIKRFAEQWLIWIAVDIVSVIMWVIALSGDGASIAVLLMWIVFLVNAVIMFVNWLRHSSREVGHG